MLKCAVILNIDVREVPFIVEFIMFISHSMSF